ncbi:Bco2, partial [Symbiodinium sp. CCMP2456]
MLFDSVMKTWLRREIEREWEQPLDWHVSAASNSANWAPALGVAAAATAVAANRRQSRLGRRAVGERSEAARQPKTSRSAVTEKLVTSIDPSAGPQGTYQVGIDFKNWLQSAEEELEVDGLRVEGHIPAWLRGHLATALVVHVSWLILGKMPQHLSQDLEDSSPGIQGRCLEETDVLEQEEEVLRPRRERGVPGAGQILSSERERGLEDFAVAFGGGGVRSGAFCTGALWALAEVGRLRHVTHLSSVSGGSIAASGFASFLVGRQPTEDGKPDAAATDSWYREVVAEFIERSQRNAGYLVSFNNLWKAPEDDSSSVPRILDLPLMALVVLGVLVAAPVIFCVFYVVPVSLLIEAYWGGTLRHCFCIPPSTKRKCSVADLIQLSGAVSGYVIGCFVLALVVLAFIYKCTHLEGRRPTRRYLYWRSCVNLSSRWLVMLLLILATVLLVYTAEWWDYGELRASDGANVCLDYWRQVNRTQGDGLCSGVWPKAPHWPGQQHLHDFRLDTIERIEEVLPFYFNSSKVEGDPSFGEERRVPFILLFFLITVLFGLVALSFKALGWGGVLRVFLVVLLPLWFIWPTTFLLQWRIFGPVTHQPLFTPLFGTQIFGQYSDKAWNYFTGIFLTLAIVALPGFNFFHRFVHIYFRVSLQRAFYCGGKDVPTQEVAKCPWSPILLFGATLNEYQRPQDEEPHCLFSLSQHAMGCERTKYLRSPQWMTLSKCMTLSCAAIDGFVLTQINKWHTRILMAMLNLTQGDWLRFDMGQNWHSLSKRYPSLLEQPHLASLIDRLPEILTLSCIYLFCLIFNQNSSYSAGQNEVEACTPFWIFRFLASAFIGVFIGGLSFFGHVRCFAWLLASPVIRQIHMFLMHHECMENPPMYLYLTDGGPVEDLGLVQLLRRRRRWILSFDVGDDPACELIDLRAAIALARKERICSFYLAEDPRRDLEEVIDEFAKGRERFLHLGVLYKGATGEKREIGEIFHVRMRLLDPPTGVAVQPLVQAEEVTSQRTVLSAARQMVHLCPPQSDLELSAPMNVGQDYTSSQTSGSSDSTPTQKRAELGGICCECCHDWAHGGACGAFPNTHTVNQFFTPKVWANFCRLGREMAAPAIEALTNAQATLSMAFPEAVKERFQSFLLVARSFEAMNHRDASCARVHAGPAKFEFGDDEFVDWVDGQAMLYRLKIGGDGECQYKNRWLDTWNHRMHREAGRIAVRETCSRPSLKNFWERFMYLFSPPNNENGNLHISQIAGSRCVSMSVGSACLEFELDNMNTLGKVPFDDELVEGGPLIFHAEPHVDKDTGEWVTCAIQLRISPEDMGLKPEYVVFSVMPDTSKTPGAPVQRRLIRRISTEYPSPVHTIALTKKYIVMIQIPYPLNWDGMLNAEARWLMNGVYEGNLNDYNTWQPERPTTIRIINRITGEETQTFETDPFFFFHIINSFEEAGGPSGEDEIVNLDVVCYNEPPVGFPLRQARSGDVEDWRGGGGEVRRFAMNIRTGECTCTGWPDNCFDEPKINPKVDGIRHKYSWGVIDDNGMLRLTKQDHDSKEVWKWEGQDVSRELPWQPVFVPEPYSNEEDAGAILSFVRDQPTGDTFCVVLDSKTMQEQARIHFPKGHHVPL